MSHSYTFGDSALARERLGIVAETFEAPTRALIADLPPSFVRYVIDVGCGPGYTSALLADAFPMAPITGFDLSPAMLEEARARVPRATFVRADITKPLKLPADILFARLVLGHVRDSHVVMDTWARSLRPGSGTMVCEEPLRFGMPDEWFERYEAAVASVIAGGGGSGLGGEALDHTPFDTERSIDRVVEHPVPVTRAAAMFWRNAVQWGDQVPDGTALVDHFRALERSDDDRVVTWQLRQATYVRRRG